MRYAAILGMVCLAALGSVMGCGTPDPEPNPTTSGTGGTGGMGGGENTGGMGGTAGGGMGGSGGGMGGAGGGSMSVKVNGCDSATAQDETANATVKITFGADNKYTPACIRVKKGTKVTLEGTFSTHPLSPGEYKFPPMPDLTSPIQPTMTGSAITFTMDTVGVYPYYCDYHASSGMQGAVFVE